MTLVIMAAGMGSRFGGLKQIEPIGPNKEFLIDYSIYDCIKYGFDKVVFIIKEENYEIFKNTIGKRVEEKIKVEYVFQSLDNIPSPYKVPNTRIKPLGTAHAIYCCKDVIKDNFAIINADDFYGSDAFKKAALFLKNTKNENEFGMIAYQVDKTLTENGSVKRGICQIKNNCLESLIESKVEKINNEIICKPLNGAKEFSVPSNTPVSMNMFLFTPTIFKYLEKDLETFLSNKNNLETEEFLIPDVVFDHINKKDITVTSISTNSTWYGVTYKDDTPFVRQSIKKLIDEKEYPINLW